MILTYIIVFRMAGNPTRGNKCHILIDWSTGEPLRQIIHHTPTTNL